MAGSRCDMSARDPGRAVRCQDCATRAACALNRLRFRQRAHADLQIHERTFHRGDVIVEEGQVAKNLRVVKLGVVFGYRRGLDGRSRPIGAVGRGVAIGSFGTIQLANQVTCVAMTAARVCELPAAELNRTGIGGASLQMEVGRFIAEAFAALSAWSEVMRLSGVVNQLAYVLVLLADANRESVVQLPSHEALAELLGTRRESIARALRALEMEGGIRRHERKRCEVRRDRLLLRLVNAS